MEQEEIWKLWKNSQGQDEEAGGVTKKCESPDNMEIKNLQRKIDLILEREDIKWKQRAKQNWFQNGGRNTQFFFMHGQAIIRKVIVVIKSEMMRGENGRNPKTLAVLLFSSMRSCSLMRSLLEWIDI